MPEDYPAYLDYPEDHPLFATMPPPVIQSSYDPTPPPGPPTSPSWPAITAVVAVCLAVIAVIATGVVILTGPTRTVSAPPAVTSVVPAPPTVTSVVTSPVPVPGPRATVTAPAPPPVVVAPPPVPVSSCPQRLRDQANIDYPLTAAQATGLWVPQLSSKQPGLVADGITWDCNSILAEHLRLRGLYGAKLLWSGDWPHTYGHDDYWVTVAGYTYDTAEGARQWCQDHGRDVPEHCYPTQIR